MPDKPRDHAAALLAGFDAGDLSAIEAETEKLLSAGGTSPDLLRLFAMLAEKLKADSVAEKFYSRLVKLNPMLPGQHRKLGQIQLRLGQRGAAMRTLNAALSVDKTDTTARTELAGLLDDLGRQDEARKHYRTVTEQDPENAGAWLRFARCCSATNRLDEAIDAFDRAIALDQEQPAAHVGKAEVLLALGRFKQGWNEYTWRPDGRATDPSGTPVSQISSFAGKHVLLRQEIGLPETLLGLRYAPLLRESGARVTLAVDRMYMPLLLDSDLADDMIEAGADGADCDVEMKLLTAASFLRAGEATQPLASGYLTPVTKSPKVAEKGLRVGIALRAPGSRDETIPVARLREVLTKSAPVSFVSLENTGAEDFRSIN
ncbi:MAG: tetratricopeptide repeat protein, partial [Rhodospirillales bacterium]